MKPTRRVTEFLVCGNSCLGVKYLIIILLKHWGLIIKKIIFVVTWKSSYSVQLSLLTWLAHQSLIVSLVDTSKMPQMVGSSTYWLRIMLPSDSIFKSCACCYFCSSDNNFHSLFSCAKSCKWIRTDFSHDLFIICEECVALACNNGITAGLKLEVPFLVSLSVVCPCCGDNACHPHRPSNSCVP